MKRLLGYSIFILLTFCINNGFSTTIMGGAITYKKAKGDSLEITLTVYRDCNGGGINNAPITIASNSSTRNFTLAFVSKTDVTGVGPNCNAKSRCSQGGGGTTLGYGIEQHVFRSVIPVELTADCKYTISWSSCCRNSNITTGAANKDFHIYATYDKCVSPKNSSPVFISPQRVLIPVGQDARLSFLALDTIDYDEVTYEIINPFTAKGVNAVYSGSWSAQRPISFLGFPNSGLNPPAGFRFDTLTSNLLFRPTVSGQSTIMAVKAKEWRVINGVKTLISETIRDIQLIVITSPNNRAPRVGNISQQTRSVIESCKAGTFCVDIPVTDIDNSDSLTVKIEHSFGSLNASVTTNTNNNITVNICYTLDSINFKSGSSRYFKIIASDNSCPIYNTAERTYVHQIDSVAEVTLPNNINTFCDNSFPTALVSNPSYGIWSGTGVNNNTFFPTIAKRGIHKLTYDFEDSITGCKAKRDLLVKVYPQHTASFTTNKTTGQPSDTFKFANSTNVLDTSFQVFWDMGQDTAQGNTSSNLSVSHVYNDTGTFKVSLRVVTGVCPPDTAFETIVVALLSPPTSTKERVSPNIKIYPNPAKDLINIESKNSIAAISIFDAAGKLVLEKNQQTSNTVQLKVNNLSHGIYTLRINYNNGESSMLRLSIKQ